MKKQFRTRKRDLPANMLRTDKDYQRVVVKSWAAFLANTFAAEKFGILHVSERSDGSWYILDGQHRWEALKILGKGHFDVSVPCLIYYGLTRQQEADQFRSLNNSKNMTAYAKFKAGLFAKYEDEVAVNKIANAAGFKISNNPSPGNIHCVKKMMTVYNKNPDFLKSALRTIVESWGFDHEVHNGLIGGLGLLAQKFNGQIDDNRTAKVLKKAGSPETVMGKARGRRELMGGNVDVNVADTIIDLYNKGIRSGKLAHIRK